MKKKKFTGMGRLCGVTLLIIGSYVVWGYTNVESPEKNSLVFKTQSNTFNINPDIRYDCSGVTTIPKDECRALVDLYESMSGDNRTHNGGWLGTENPCTWKGVLCENNNVTAINLSKNNLEGSIPESISHFTEINDLLLGDNNIKGEIPKSIGDLTELKHIELGKNNLTGEIPKEFGNIGESTINIAVFINENDLCGTIPRSLKENGQIKSLHVDKNNLTIVQGEYDENMWAWVNDIVYQGSQNPELCN